jgi:hypothetical protein
MIALTLERAPRMARRLGRPSVRSGWHGAACTHAHTDAAPPRADYLTNDALKWVVENAGAKLQFSINSKTSLVVLGDTTKDAKYIGSKKEVALAEQKQRAAEGRRGLIKVMTLRDFARAYDLEDELEPELLWAICRSPNDVPPEQRKKG